MLAALPTEAEKLEMREGFTALSQFLATLRQNFQALPSSEDMAGVKKTLQKLDELLSQAQAKPALAAMLGFRRSAASGRRSDSVTGPEAEKAKAALAGLQVLPLDRIRAKLESEEYSVSELRAIASQLRIRSTEKLGKEALAHQVAMKIANYRGYEMLRGGRDEESARPSGVRDQNNTAAGTIRQEPPPSGNANGRRGAPENGESAERDRESME